MNFFEVEIDRSRRPFGPLRASFGMKILIVCAVFILAGLMLSGCLKKEPDSFEPLAEYQAQYGYGDIAPADAAEESAAAENQAGDESAANVEPEAVRSSAPSEDVKKNSPIIFEDIPENNVVEITDMYQDAFEGLSDADFDDVEGEKDKLSKWVFELILALDERFLKAENDLVYLSTLSGYAGSAETVCGDFGRFADFLSIQLRVLDDVQLDFSKALPLLSKDSKVFTDLMYQIEEKLFFEFDDRYAAEGDALKAGLAGCVEK